MSRELPDWLEAKFELRFRTESRRAQLFVAGADDVFGLSRLRLSLGGAPSKHVRFLVEGQDARITWHDPERTVFPAVNHLDLRQAWVEVGGDGDDGANVKLRVGRQMIRFGGERLFGERRWNNLSPTWDAARLTLSHGKNAVDVLSMSMTDPRPGFDRPYPATGHGNVHGAYGSIGSVVPRAAIEPYLFYVTRPRNGPLHDYGPDAGAWSGGLRIAGATQNGWAYEAEWTEQRGHARQTALRGGMGAVQVSYGASAWPWKTRVHFEHEYASGDRDPNDGRVTTYDNLFAGRRLHIGMLNLLGRRNIRDYETGFEAQARTNLRLRLEAHAFWVASRYDALYFSDGTPVLYPPAGGAASARAGEEIDFTVLWTPNRVWELETGAMRFFSGPFVRETAGNSPAGVLLFIAATLRL